MKLLESLRGRLLLAGIVLLLVGAVFPWWSRTQVTSAGAQTDERVFSLGLPSAPWLRSVNSRQENPDNTITYTTGRTFYPLSGSTWIALAGLVLIACSAVMRGGPPQPPRTKT